MMNIQQFNTKENAKKVRLISMVLSFVAILIIGLSAIAPIVNVYIPGNTDPEFTYATGQSFLGWQVTFYYFGPNIPIADRQAFKTNPVMIIAMVGTCIALLVTTLCMRKGKRLKKGICEIISVVFLLFTAIVYLNACPIVLSTAGNLTLDAITTASKTGGYTLGWYSVFLAIAVLLIAVCKILSAVFFILFRKKAELNEIKVVTQEKETDNEKKN